MKHARKDYDRIQDPAGLIPEDEPVFLLRGQDVSAPLALAAYAVQASADGASDELVLKVVKHAGRMKKWQREHAVKVADL